MTLNCGKINNILFRHVLFRISSLKLKFQTSINKILLDSR